MLPGTTNVRGWPDELLLDQDLLPETTVFCCREITPLPKDQLSTRIGSVTGEWLESACGVLSSVLGCG